MERKFLLFSFPGYPEKHIQKPDLNFHFSYQRKKINTLRIWNDKTVQHISKNVMCSFACPLFCLNPCPSRSDTVAKTVCGSNTLVYICDMQTMWSGTALDIFYSGKLLFRVSTRVVTTRGLTWKSPNVNAPAPLFNNELNVSNCKDPFGRICQAVYEVRRFRKVRLFSKPRVFSIGEVDYTIHPHFIKMLSCLASRNR